MLLSLPLLNYCFSFKTGLRIREENPLTIYYDLLASIICYLDRIFGLLSDILLKDFIVLARL
jgi:hypothetical protein